MIHQLLQTTCWIISSKLQIPSMDWLELLSKVKLTNKFHRKELEDTIGVFDGACVELELKRLDESGRRKQVYKKALSKNMQELDDKKEELHENKCKLEKLIEETTPKKRNIPHFVDVTHLGIVNEEVGNASDSSDK